MNTARVIVVVSGLLIPASSWAQAPTSIGLNDLLNGGWSKSSHYEPDFKTKAASDQAKLEAEKKDFDKSQEKAKQGWDYAKKGYDKAKKGYELFKDYQDLMHDYDHLTPKDGPFDPNYSPPGMPQVPVSCAGSAACGQCYEDAYAKLNAVRVRFEKLRVLNASTKAWIAKALSFGDNAASIHGIAGLAWQSERRKIEKSIASFDAAYDAKYNELMGVLKEALDAIAKCEAEHFHEPDWYNRFGFMYYSFMADRYRQ